MKPHYTRREFLATTAAGTTLAARLDKALKMRAIWVAGDPR